MLSWVEYEKSFITSEPDLVLRHPHLSMRNDVIVVNQNNATMLLAITTMFSKNVEYFKHTVLKLMIQSVSIEDGSNLCITSYKHTVLQLMMQSVSIEDGSNLCITSYKHTVLQLMIQSVSIEDGSNLCITSYKHTVLQLMMQSVSIEDGSNLCITSYKEQVLPYLLVHDNYSRTSMARTSLGPWKFVRDMGSSSHWGLIMAPVQEANSDNLGKSFRFSTQWLYVECTH